MNIIFVMIGGAIGAILRFVLGVVIMKKNPNPPIPVAMIIVNILGSFGLGLFLGINYRYMDASMYEEPLFLLIGIGFFGAFTTFSTFSVETMQLLQRNRRKEAAFYVLITILLSFALFSVGFIGTQYFH